MSKYTVVMYNLDAAGADRKVCETLAEAQSVVNDAKLNWVYVTILEVDKAGKTVVIERYKNGKNIM